MNYTNELLYSVSIVKYEKRLIHPMFIIPIKILYAYFIFLSFIKNQENTISKIKVINIPNLSLPIVFCSILYYCQKYTIKNTQLF